MKKGRMDYVVTIMGIVLLGIGLYMVKTLVNPQGFLLAFPYVCVGVGCGIFGHGLGNSISRRTMKNNPDLQKQHEISKNDERNITIANLSKAKAYDIMIFVFGALLLSFALMGVDMVVILLLVFVYLFVQGSGIYYRCKYEKEM